RAHSAATAASSRGVTTSTTTQSFAARNAGATFVAPNPVPITPTRTVAAIVVLLRDATRGSGCQASGQAQCDPLERQAGDGRLGGRTEAGIDAQEAPAVRVDDPARDLRVDVRPARDHVDPVGVRSDVEVSVVGAVHEAVGAQQIEEVGQVVLDLHGDE